MDEPKVPSQEELLWRALDQEPKTYDSEGRAYFLGPTVGMIVSLWCEANSGTYNKMREDLIDGMPDEDFFEKYKGAKGFTKHHFRWVKEQIAKDLERAA